MLRSIPAIDRDITGIRRELVRRVGRFNQYSAAEWQAAWDQCPDLRQRETSLYLERGLAQQERDKREHDRAMSAARAARIPKRKRCPTCGR